MTRIKERILKCAPLLALLQGVLARRINTTIYDTDIAHITYAPNNDFCIRWENSWWNWNNCAVWAKPWQSEFYKSGGKYYTIHRSLGHQLASMTIEFEGSAIWLYGPPRSQLTTIPGDYKVCLRETHRMVYDPICYRVNTAEAYSTSEYDSPVVIFAKGGLQYQKHRVVVSVSEPEDETRKYQGIQFSHAVYTIERPVPWPLEEDSWRFRQVVIHDTHPLISYSPMGSIASGPCTGNCWVSHASGWSAKTYTDEGGHVVSWHELKSRNEWSQDQWGIDLTVTGSAVYVYGAPRSLIESKFASQHVCINNVCHVVDVQQAYLNALKGPVESTGVHQTSDPSTQNHLDANVTTLSPIHPELDPVLIWSMTGLDDQKPHTLRLALASLPSDDNAEMSIAKVVYTKVSYETGQSRPDTPIPQPDTTYEGPLYPPHATKWVARGPLPRLPTPQPVRKPREPDVPRDPGEMSTLLMLFIMAPFIVLVFIFIRGFS
ncbi:unnamed protein product [Rhizoctonia solani]|uniref:Uncharacterized protein n=1 Tax=Rhizoctonia solani TaxID=456999 RepID=A0A8H2Y1Z4_9AGAM|nr:unnamed protein product [Rhizoctonia solani]